MSSERLAVQLLARILQATPGEGYDALLSALQGAEQRGRQAERAAVVKYLRWIHGHELIQACAANIAAGEHQGAADE